MTFKSFSYFIFVSRFFFIHFILRRLEILWEIMVENCQSITDLILSPQQKINFENGNINVFLGCVKPIENRKRETDLWRFMTMLNMFVVFWKEKEEKGFAFYPNYTFSVRLTNKERTTFLCLQHLSDQNQEVYHLSSRGLEEWIVVCKCSFHSLVYCFPRSASLLLLNKLKDGTIEMEEEMLNVEMARVVRINFLIQFKLAFLSSLV